MDKRPDRIRTMFDAVAGTYRVMNRLITFGGDVRIRRLAVRLARLDPARTLLDVATGTGDIIETALKRHSHLRATGVDFSTRMLAVAARRPGLRNVRFVHGDALALPFENGSFDRITSGYLIRNVADVEACFTEQFRVLRPGGRVICVETTPPTGMWAPLVRGHLKFGIPLLGTLISRRPQAYRYLPDSTRRFKSPGEVTRIMERVGFRPVAVRMTLLGTVAIHTGVKPQ